MNLFKQRKRQQRKVGHEEEGSSSNRPELAAFVLALRGTPMTKPMLYLCDNQALRKAVKRWVGEGGKATLVGAPDADKAISGKDVPTEWHDRTNQAVFTWQEPHRKGGTVSYENRKSTWNSGVRKAIRRESAEDEVRKHRDRKQELGNKSANQDDKTM